MRQNAKVYVIQAADGRLKVGHSTNVARRARELGEVAILYETDVIVEAERV